VEKKIRQRLQIYSPNLHPLYLKVPLTKTIFYAITRGPQFHHWITDDKRFGLTFQRSDDAKSFHKGIKIAVADLIDGRYST
jgi:uncharacterized membrane protein YbaN (DUF454 family)